METKKLVLLLLVSVFVLSCTKNDEEIFESEQIEDLSLKTSINSIKGPRGEGPIIIGDDDPVPVCQKRYEPGLWVEYIGGSSDLAQRLREIKIIRLNLSLQYTPTVANPCPKYKLPSITELRYDSNNDMYYETWDRVWPFRPDGASLKIDVDDPDGAD